MEIGTLIQMKANQSFAKTVSPEESSSFHGRDLARSAACGLCIFCLLRISFIDFSVNFSYNAQLAYSSNWRSGKLQQIKGDLRNYFRARQTEVRCLPMTVQVSEIMPNYEEAIMINLDIIDKSFEYAP